MKIKNKRHKKVYRKKRKLKFKFYKDCLKATQLENKTNQIKNNNFNTEPLRENHNEFIKNNKLILKTQPRFKSEMHNVFTEEIYKTKLSSNDDKRMQSIYSAEKNETSKDLICKKEKTRCNNIIKQCKKMIKFDDVTKENIKKHN